MSNEPQAELRPHRGIFVITFGVLSFVGGFFGIVFGPIAWITGRRDLKAMDAGVMDIQGRALTQTGHLLGFIMTLFWAFVLFAALVFLAIGLFFATSQSSYNDYDHGHGDTSTSTKHEWYDDEMDYAPEMEMAPPADH